MRKNGIFNWRGFDFFKGDLHKAKLQNGLIKKIITIIYRNKNPLNLFVYCNFNNVGKANSSGKIYFLNFK